MDLRAENKNSFAFLFFFSSTQQHSTYMAEQVQEGGGGAPAAAAAPAPAPAPAAAAAAAPDLLGLRQADQVGVARSRKRRGGISPLWAAVTGLPPTDAPSTHKCVHCDQNLVLSRNRNGSWVVTGVKRHLKACHADVLAKLELPATEKKTRITTLFQFGMQKQGAASIKKKIADGRAAIQTFYTHNPQLISKATITGHHFREMLRICAGVPPKQHAKLRLSNPSIVALQKVEYQQWTKRLKDFIELNLKFSKSNPFAQGLHDCVTLKNGKKFLAIGLACVDPWLKANHMICLGFVPVASSSATTVAAAINHHCQQIIGCKYTDFAHSTMSDYAALNVAAEFGHEREGCAMHNDDKCARYAVGDLQRTRRKHVVEPFEDGVALMNKVQKGATYFAWDHRRAHLRSMNEFIQGGVPNVVPKTNICTTRVAARHTTLRSILLLNRVLQHYASVNPNDSDVKSWAMTPEEWAAVAEMEAVTKVITDTTTLVQTEKAQMGAMGYVIHCELLKRLRSDRFEVLDLDRITEHEQRRRIVLVSDFTPIGRKCLQRARLEAERRLCGSTALSVDDVSGTSKVQRQQRETLCLALDPRTHHLIVAKTFDKATRVAACAEVKNLYVDFFITAERPTVDLQKFRGANRGGGQDEVDDDDLFAIENDGSDTDGPTIEEWETARRKSLAAEFDGEFRAYSRFVKQVDWSAYGKRVNVHDIPTDPAAVSPFAHLLRLNILPWIEEMPRHMSRIQLLLTHSKASVASVPAASFCERVNSAGGIVSTKGNVNMDPEEISHRVPLRMNGSFWAFLDQQIAASEAAPADGDDGDDVVEVV